MTESKIVVVWGKLDVLSSSIEYFLADKKDWKVVCISDIEELFSFIHTVEPGTPGYCHHSSGRALRSSRFPTGIV